MRRYETFIILNPDLSAEQRLPVVDRVRDILTQMAGFLIRIDEWGSRKLAYAIAKKERGFYVRFDFCGTGQLVNEMERFFRIDERVLKHMSVLLDESPDLERIKEEMAKAEAEAQKPAEIAPAAPAEIAPAAPAAPAEPAPAAAAEPQPSVSAETPQEA